MCQIANRLRMNWYSTARPVKIDPASTNVAAWETIDADRATKAYRDTLGEYLQHRATCPDCNTEMLADAQPGDLISQAAKVHHPRPVIAPEKPAARPLSPDVLKEREARRRVSELAQLARAELQGVR